MPPPPSVVGRWPVRCEEDLVERRAAQRDVLGGDPASSSARTTSRQRAPSGRATGALTRRVSASISGSVPRPRARAARRPRASCVARRARRRRSGRRRAAAFSCVRRALGDHPPAVDHRDPVGELVGLLEVLRGQQHRGAVGDQRADRRPDLVAAARVQPGGRLVEEQHRRARGSGRPRGRAAGASRRSTARPACRPRRPARTAPAARPPARRARARRGGTAGRTSPGSAGR